MKQSFENLARSVSKVVGSAGTFFVALFLILTWLAAGPFARFSERWQLVINTVTTIITFLLVILIQNTQNRDDKAVHDKLDELIRAIEGADKRLIEVEERPGSEPRP